MTQPADHQFELFAKAPADAAQPRAGAGAREGEGGAGERKLSRRKEKEVMPASPAVQQPPAPGRATVGLTNLSHATRPWPAALTWADALAYTSFSPRSLRSAELEGKLNFRRVGPNGGKVVARQQLDQLLVSTFGAPRPPIDEDFDFG